MIGALVLLVGGIAMLVQSSSWLGDRIDAPLRRFPRAAEFCFGALFGVFAGVMPAAIAYAVTAMFWISLGIDAAVAIACGLLWAKWSSRLSSRRSSKSASIGAHSKGSARHRSDGR